MFGVSVALLVTHAELTECDAVFHLCSTVKCRAKVIDEVSLFYDFMCVILDVYTAESVCDVKPL